MLLPVYETGLTFLTMKKISTVMLKSYYDFYMST